MKKKKSKILSSKYAGAIPFSKFYDRMEIGSLVSKHLGKRPNQSLYQWPEYMKAWCLTTYTAGPKLIKIEESRRDLKVVKKLSLPSHDTMGRCMKSLATDNIHEEHINEQRTSEGIKNYILNYNDKLVDLNISLLVDFGFLIPGQEYEMDVDVTNIPSMAYEAQSMYKIGPGFAPIFATIGNMPIATCMRSGNTPSHMFLPEFIDYTIASLAKHNIIVSRIHLDGASYQAIPMAHIKAIDKTFVIGGRETNTIYKNLEENAIWKTGKYASSTHIFDYVEYTSIPHQLTKDKNVYRLAVMRVKESGRSADSDPSQWYRNDKYYYNFIVTNDYISTEKELFDEYRQRGNAELVFKALKSNFGLKILPFSNLNQNHVFIITQVILHNIYLRFLKFVSDIEEGIRTNMSLNLFKTAFMENIVLLINNRLSFLPTNNIDYEKLM